jgi:hypothetical protein
VLVKEGSVDRFAPWHERWVVADMARRREKGGGVLDRHGEGEWGAGPMVRVACSAGSGKIGQMANGPMKKQEKIIFEFRN